MTEHWEYVCLCVRVSRGGGVHWWLNLLSAYHQQGKAHKCLCSSAHNLICFHSFPPITKTSLVLLVSYFLQVDLSACFGAVPPFTFIPLPFVSHHLYIFSFCTFCFKGDSVRAGFNIEMKTAGKVAPLRVCMRLYTQLQIEGFLLHCSPASGWNWLVTICYFSSIRLSRHLSQRQSPHPWCSYISIYWQLMKSVFVSL